MTISERLRMVFALVLSDPDIVLHDETTARDIEGWDSVAHVNLMFAIETEFDVEFVGNEFATFVDVGHLLRTVESKLSQHAG